MPVTSNPSNQASDIRPLPGAWLVVALLWGVGCLNYLDRNVLTTMRESLKLSIPMSDADFGLLTTTFLMVYGILSPLGGWCADRFSRSKIILVSLCVWSAVTLATAFVQTYPQLIATRVLMGVSEACYIPAALALIADYHRGSTRSLATGIHMSGIYAGVALGGMGGWMADHLGWAHGFFIFGAVGLLLGGLLAVMLRDAPSFNGASTEKSGDDPLETLAILGRTRAFWIIALHWGLLGFAGWAFTAWMPTFLRERYQLSQTEAGFTATAYMQVAAFAGVLCGGAWADRWSLTQLRGRVWVPMIALSLASPFVYFTSITHTLGLAVICLIAFGFARGCSDSNMMPILCQVAAPKHRATGYGVLNFFSCSIGGLAAYLGGWLKDHAVNLNLLLAGSAVLVLVSGLLLALVRPERRN